MDFMRSPHGFLNLQRRRSTLLVTVQIQCSSCLDRTDITSVKSWQSLDHQSSSTVGSDITEMAARLGDRDLWQTLCSLHVSDRTSTSLWKCLPSTHHTYKKKIRTCDNSIVRSLSIVGTCEYGKIMSKYSIHNPGSGTAELKSSLWRHVVDTMF